MSQQNIFPLATSEGQQIENKILLLYLIDKMDIPVSNSQIAQFAQSEDLMNYYTVQKYLDEMVNASYLEKIHDNNNTRYTITEDGSRALDSFIKQIPQSSKNIVIRYVTENRKSIKQDFEVIANYFFDYNNNEYIVKCGAYEDEIMLMELNISVISKEQALQVCNNWKANVSAIYGKIIKLLIDDTVDDTDQTISDNTK